MDWFIAAYRVGFLACRRLKRCCGIHHRELKIEIPVHKLPWLWIGAHFSDSNVITVTEMINHQVQYGVPVTPEFLEEVTGYINAEWKYMDSHTLEEKVFPSEGIVIDGP